MFSSMTGSPYLAEASSATKASNGILSASFEARLMVESTKRMVNRWTELIASCQAEINVEEEVTNAVGDLVAGASCSMSSEEGKRVLGKLRALQRILFNSERYGKFLNPKQTLKANKLGKEIDAILYSKVKERIMQEEAGDRVMGDVVGVLMAGMGEGERMKAFTAEEMVDECKGFIFTGYETTAMAVAWSLPLSFIDFFRKYKMGWVMNEVLRLYGTVPNLQRAARHDIRVDNSNLVIPNGTNIWIDIVSMHHDHGLWGEDVNEFKTERFENDIYGGCNHRMGFLPFGFGGRMCIGKNLANLVYRVMLTLILSKFSFSLSPNYRHSPTLMISLRPAQGIPLIFRNL